MLNKDEILAYLEEMKDEFFSEYHLVKLGLFGSFARNEASEESDIDLIVEFEPNTKNLSEKKSQLRSSIKKRFNRELDFGQKNIRRPMVTTKQIIIF